MRRRPLPAWPCYSLSRSCTGGDSALHLAYPTLHGRYSLTLAPFVRLSLELGLMALFTPEGRRGTALALLWLESPLFVNLYILLEVVPEFYGLV